MGELEIFQIDIRDDDRDGREPKLKIVWNYHGRPSRPYFIPVQLVEERSRGVRLSLQRLINKGMSNHGRLEHYREEFRDIAAAGYDLYCALFHPGDGFDATTIQDWVRGETGRIKDDGRQAQMSFTVDSNVHVPWGLIFDLDMNGVAEEDELDLAAMSEHFWCLKFLVSSVHYRILPDDQVKSLSSLDRIVSVVHRDAFNKALNCLTQSEDEILKDGILDWIVKTFGPSVENSQALYHQWALTGERARLLFFFCHANSHNLALSADDEISISDFRQKLAIRRANQESTCMVFLNGCDTAVGAPKGAFLEATSELLFCGFVGTETKIPDVFALRFGLSFLYYFLHEGWPVHRIMALLLRQHWPLSMAYSSYCSPTLSFTPVSASLGIRLSDNFSTMLLGTSQL